MRALNVLAAILAPGAGHARMHRVGRGLFWVALILLSIPTMRWTPWLVLSAWLGQIIDAGLIDEGDARAVSSLLFGVAGNAILVTSALFMRSHFTDLFSVSSGSMIPTLQVGDHFAVDKTVHQARRGDVVVFAHPHERGKDMIKRVIAVAGDTIEIVDGELRLNGQPVPRRHVEGDCRYRDQRAEVDKWEERQCDAWDETLDGQRYRVVFDLGEGSRSMGPITVPPASFFVIGDNRDNSSDSRYWGSVPDGNLKGRLAYIYWPLSRSGKPKSVP